MKNQISSAAHAASRALAQQGHRIPRSHLSEVLAALLGYRTYAALILDEANPKLDYHLEDAELYVLNVPLAQERATQLQAEAATPMCVTALMAEITVPMFVSLAEFYDSHARELLEEAITDGEYTAGVMAESNASFPDAPDLEEGIPSDNLWQASTDWSIEASGTLVGEYDPDGDRMFNDDTLDVWAKLQYTKAGRAGLIFVESEDGAAQDDSWRDED